MHGIQMMTIEKIIGASLLATAMLAAPTIASAMQDNGDGASPATIDSNGDGKPDAWDTNGDGKADAWDTDGDGKPDQVDRDGDGKPDAQPHTS